MLRSVSCSLALLVLAGCGSGSPTYTLYRSSTASDERVHWATFNVSASEDLDYNRDNCRMAAGLLNANLKRVNPTDPVRFWCEEGTFKA